jgi:hypothetical protein
VYPLRLHHSGKSTRGLAVFIRVEGRTPWQSSDTEPWFIRYVLFERRYGGLYVTRFQSSDPEPVYHNHPWWMLTFFLGSYVEDTPGRRVKRRAGQVVFRRAQWVHRLEIERPMWTVTLHGPKNRAWCHQFADGTPAFKGNSNTWVPEREAFTPWHATASERRGASGTTDSRRRYKTPTH